MPPTRKKQPLPAAVSSPVVSGVDRTALIEAYKAGLILAWRHDVARGYCLTLPGQRDTYVEVDRLTKYLQQLGAR